MPTNTPDQPTSSSKPSWKRRISHPVMPSIPRPNLPHLASGQRLRTALLGYLGEVETALRRRKGQGDTDGSTGLETLTEQDATGSSVASLGRSTSIASGSSSLRARSPNNALGMNVVMDSDVVSVKDEQVMEQVAALKEDVGRYLSPEPASAHAAPQHRVQWMKNLPDRLSLLDQSIINTRETSPPPNYIADDFASQAIQSARKKVIELVKAVTPSEHWSGWEKLGWEEQTTGRRRAFTLDALGNITGEVDVDEDTVEDNADDEPGYMFPNRTPQAKRGVMPPRSKSFGGASSTPWSPSALSQTVPLFRVRTAPDEPTVDDLAPEEEDIDDDEDFEWLMSATIDGVPGNLVKHRGPKVSEALMKAQDGNALINYDDLPLVWRNNEHILTGYRFIPFHATTGPIPLLKSAFAWHNETVNIHSHLIPTIVMLFFIPTLIYATPLPSAHILDTVTLVVYLLAAVSCLISSASWHVLAGSASKGWFEWGACVDYIGIAWLISASTFTIFYNAFYCHPKTVMFYGTLNIVCGLMGSILPFQAWFNKRHNKKWRITFFLFMCFTITGPMGQMFYRQGFARGRAFVAPFAPSVFTYITGLLFYGFHFPECIWPGKFDIWGCSHQIWHVAIVAAVMLHYQAIFTAHAARYTLSCGLPDATVPMGVIVDEWLTGISGDLRKALGY